MKEFSLADFIPKIARPNYLTGDNIWVSADGKEIEARVKFPKDDLAMIDRGDRVNTVFHQFAVWNAAHILRALEGVERPYVKNLTVTATHPTRTEQELTLKVLVSFTNETEKRIEGILKATFHDDVGRLHETVNCEFIAKKN